MILNKVMQEYSGTRVAKSRTAHSKYGSPPPIRAVLWVTELLDEFFLRVPVLQRFSLQVVGYMEKGE